MNKLQKDYATKKAAYETLEAQAADIEREYIIKNGIVNPDGSIPERIFMIDDEEIFDKANEETAPILDDLKQYKAREALHEAENNLIRFGLSLIPGGQKDILYDRCFGTNGKTMLLKIREQVINLAFNLDTKTIPAHLR